MCCRSQNLNLVEISLSIYSAVMQKFCRLCGASKYLIIEVLGSWDLDRTQDSAFKFKNIHSNTVGHPNTYPGTYLVFSTVTGYCTVTVAADRLTIEHVLVHRILLISILKKPIILSMMQSIQWISFNFFRAITSGQYIAECRIGLCVHILRIKQPLISEHVASSNVGF